MEEFPQKNPDASLISKRKRFFTVCTAFIRWMFILLFAAILLGGLYFKAPWKILAMDAVLLALLTVVPRKIRKYGWLALAATVLAVTIWIFIPEKDFGDWKRYSFNEEIAAFKTKHPVPDEDNGAIVIENMLARHGQYYKWPDFSKVDTSGDPNAFEIMKQIDIIETEFYPDFWTAELDKATLQNPWKSNEYPKVAQWLTEHNDDIKALIEASNKSVYQPNYTFNMLEDVFNDPIMTLSDWLELLKRAANNDWADGRIDEAINKYAALFKLSRLLARQPDRSFMLAGAFQYRHLHDVISRFIIENELNESQLNILENAIEYEQQDLERLLKQSIEYRNLKLKQLYAGMYEINDRGKIRFSRSACNEIAEKMNIQIPERKLDEQRKKLEIFISWFTMPKTPQTLAEHIDDVYERIYDMSLKDLSQEQESSPFEMNWTLLIKSFFEIDLKNCQLQIDLEDRKDFYRNVYRIYIALRKYKNKYGFWPDTLNQLTEFTTEETLVDPFNEGGLAYQKTGDNFILYSKGKNGIDEKGRCQWPEYDPNEISRDDYNKRGPIQDDILLWPDELEGTD
ncbi:MAG: hypothetical protein H8E17_05425 [Deltaproteobacteria bacterium]|nr:hypothetical protein [Deltaproteobacteria bacterium]